MAEESKDEQWVHIEPADLDSMQQQLINETTEMASLGMDPASGSILFSQSDGTFVQAVS